MRILDLTQLKRTLTTTTTLLWGINEILQLTEVLHGTKAEFFVFHCSSLFGAIIFCFLIDHFNWSKLLFVMPIFIELYLSHITCNCIDYWDEFFSVIGICIAFICVKCER
jgi:phosphoglycerol transferase MdoB-like AlkP superfamily enzyme